MHGPKLRFFLAAFFTAVLLDQLTKRWIISALDRTGAVPVIEGVFYLTNVRNPGASFSLFVIQDPALRLAVFGGLTLVAIVAILIFFRRLPAAVRAEALALGAILGGAVGNLIDRIAYGAVVDFLHVRLWGGYSWPDFNLADSFIVCGVAYLLYASFRYGEAEPAPDRPARE